MIILANRRIVNEIRQFEVFHVRPERFGPPRLLYEARSILRDSSYNSRTQIAVIHEKWSDKAISRNDHEIRSFWPNDAPLTRYDRLKFSISHQGVISHGGYCTKLDPCSAIALKIRGLKLRLYIKNSRTRPFSERIKKFGPFGQPTHR